MKIFKKLPAVIVGVLLLSLLLVGTAFATGGGGNGGDHKIDICHAHPPDTAATGWNAQSVSISSIFKGNAHDDHAADIIPAFDYTEGREHRTREWNWGWNWGWSDWSDWTPGHCSSWDEYIGSCEDREVTKHYPGKNLDTVWLGATGAQIHANGCELPQQPEPSGSIWRKVSEGPCVEGSREWYLDFKATNLQNIGAGSVYMKVYIDGVPRTYNGPGPHSDTWILEGGSHTGEIELWYSPSGVGPDVLLDRMPNSGNGKFSVEDCYVLCSQTVEGETIYGEWSEWEMQEEHEQFVRTRPYWVLFMDSQNPEHECFRTENSEQEVKSFVNQQCGRCSNVFVGWVEWVDRDGGCDDDWYNEREEFPYDNRCYDECSEGNLVSEGKVYTNPHNVGEPEWGDWINLLNGKKFREGKQYIASDWTETFVDVGTGAVCFVNEGTTEGVTELYEEECAPRWTGRFVQTYLRTVTGHWVTYCNYKVPMAADTNKDGKVSFKEAKAWEWSPNFLASECALDCEPQTWQGKLVDTFREFKDICGKAHEKGTLFGGNHYDDSCEIFDYCDWKKSQE